MTDHTKGHTVAGVRAEIKAELTKLEVFEATIDPDDTPLLHNAVCAKIADLRAALEAKPEPDWEAWRPALERFYSHWDDCFVATPMDDEDKANVQGLIAFLAPLSQRGIGDEIEAIYADAGDIIAGIHEAISRVPHAQRGMTEQEIEALARELEEACSGATRIEYVTAIIRATLSRVPVAPWPGLLTEADWREVLAHTENDDEVIDTLRERGFVLPTDGEQLA